MKRWAGYLVFAALLLTPGWAGAQDYPNKPIRLIVPFPAGTITDISARQISAVAEKTLGQPIVIDNRPGAGTSIAATAVAQSPADGYTLLYGTSQIAAAVSLYKELSYNPVTDFTPIARLALSPTFLAVNAELPIHSVKELIAYAKANPDRLTFASSGVATSAHLQGELLNKAADIKTRHIPYKNATQGVTDMATGVVSMMFYSYQAFLPFVQSGRMRVLATTAATRFPGLEDLPTMEEAGVKGFMLQGTWLGVLGPARMPAPIVERVHAAFIKAMEDPGLAKVLNTSGLLYFPANPKEFASFIPEEVARYKTIIELSGARIN